MRLLFRQALTIPDSISNSKLKQGRVDKAMAQYVSRVKSRVHYHAV